MKVRFLPQDITCDIKPNQSVLEVAQENNIFVKSVCGGVPSCAECRVRVIEGEYNVLPPSHNELSLIGTAHFVDRRRLSCQLRCFGDITVDLNEQVAKQQAQTTGKVKNRAGQREESIESHAVKGSILAESRSMLAPPSASSSGGPSAAETQARGALDRAPKGPRPSSASQPRDSRPSQQQGRQQGQQQQRPPGDGPSRPQPQQNQQRAPQPSRSPGQPGQPRPAQQQQQQQRQPPQRPGQAAPIDGEAEQNVAMTGAPGEKREGGARRRRGGRGRNKNRGGSGSASGAGPGGGGNSGTSGGPGNSGGGGAPPSVS